MRCCLKAVKQGEYYWKESVPPSGYSLNETPVPVVGGTVTINDYPNPEGSLTINKKLATVKSSGTNSGESQSFTFTVTLTAPVGTNWTTLTPALAFTQGATTITPTSDVYSAANLTRVITLNVPATGTDVKIDHIPSGTAYHITETSPTGGYSSTPVSISETMYRTVNNAPTQQTSTVEEMEGEIPSYDDNSQNAVSYAVTNKRDVGSLTLDKTVSGGLTDAGVDQNTGFTYIVTLTAPTGTDLRDYLSYATLTNANGLNATLTKVNGTAVNVSNAQTTFDGDSVVRWNWK